MGRFNGGEITVATGGILRREVEYGTRILDRLSECSTDDRDQDRIENPSEAWIKRRVIGLLLGYTDLKNYDELFRGDLVNHDCFP